MALEKWAGLYRSGVPSSAGLTCTGTLTCGCKSTAGQGEGGGAYSTAMRFAFCFREASLHGFNQSAGEEGREEGICRKGSDITDLEAGTGVKVVASVG